MSGIPALAARMPDVSQWLQISGIATAGPPFFRYTLINMPSVLGMEIGFPVTATVTPADHPDDLIVGTLPGGRYVRMRHNGPPQTLMQATATLLSWAQHEGLRWDMYAQDDGEHWACRLEEYLDVADEAENWQTDLTFRLADQ